MHGYTDVMSHLALGLSTLARQPCTVAPQQQASLFANHTNPSAVIDPLGWTPHGYSQSESVACRCWVPRQRSLANSDFRLDRILSIPLLWRAYKRLYFTDHVLIQVPASHRASSCAERGGRGQICWKSRAACGIKPEFCPRGVQLLSPTWLC